MNSAVCLERGLNLGHPFRMLYGTRDTMIASDIIENAKNIERHGVYRDDINKTSGCCCCFP
jgi:hypothetical protein